MSRRSRARPTGCFTQKSSHVLGLSFVCDAVVLVLLRQKFVSSGVNFRDTLKKRWVERTGHERGPIGTVWRLYRGARRSGRARGSNGAVAGLLPGLAAAGRP